MCDLYHNLLNELNNINQSVHAIEMTPSFHKELTRATGFSRLLDINGLPIVFIHGENSEYNFINIEQYRLRTRHNQILSIYGELYKRLLIIINGGYKIEDADKLHDSTLRDLRKFVKRLDTIEWQIAIA